MKAPESWDSGTLLDIACSCWQASALHAAVALAIFPILGKESGMTAAAVAKRAASEPRATGLLLDALAALGLVVKKDATYTATPFSRKHLLPGTDEYLGDIVLHHRNIASSWMQLELAVRTGRAVEKSPRDAQDERENFLMGMHNLASLLAPAVAAGIDLGSRRRLLDLGGGPGTYAIHFCRANPMLEATIFDRPGTRPVAARVTGQHGLSCRIGFIAGDFSVDPLPDGHDAAWLSHVLHSNSPAVTRQIIFRVAAALKPASQIMIHDFFLDDSGTAPLFSTLFSLNMLIQNGVGRSFAEREVRDMLREAGCSAIETFRPLPGGNSYVVLARTAGSTAR